MKCELCVRERDDQKTGSNGGTACWPSLKIEKVKCDDEHLICDIFIHRFQHLIENHLQSKFVIAFGRQNRLLVGALHD